MPQQQTWQKPETLAREDPPGKTDGSGTSLTPGMENYRQPPGAAVHFRVAATEPPWEVSEQRPQGLMRPPAAAWAQLAGSRGQRTKQGVRRAGRALHPHTSAARRRQLACGDATVEVPGLPAADTGVSCDPHPLPPLPVDPEARFPRQREGHTPSGCTQHLEDNGTHLQSLYTDLRVKPAD